MDLPKRYIYHLNSEYQARKFNQLYRVGRKCHGKTLQVLKKYKIEDYNNVSDSKNF